MDDHDRRSQGEGPIARLGWLFGWVRLAILWERLWRNLWSTVAVVAVFVSIALFDLLPHLSYWVHWAVLIGFAILGAVRLRQVFKEDYAVTEKQIRNRIEKDSDLAHRPLTALKDSIVSARAGSRNEILSSE